MIQLVPFSDLDFICDDFQVVSDDLGVLKKVLELEGVLDNIYSKFKDDSKFSCFLLPDEV